MGFDKTCYQTSLQNATNHVDVYKALQMRSSPKRPGVHETFCQYAPALFPWGWGRGRWVKRPGRQADNLSRCSAEIKNVWSYFATSCLPSCHGSTFVRDTEEDKWHGLCLFGLICVAKLGDMAMKWDSEKWVQRPSLMGSFASWKYWLCCKLRTVVTAQWMGGGDGISR